MLVLNQVSKRYRLAEPPAVDRLSLQIADTLLVVRNALTRGRTAALATVAGIAGGCVVHAFLSAIGVSIILVRSAEAFAALQLCGATYLIVLGVQSVRRWLRADLRSSTAPDGCVEPPTPRGGCGRSWRACSPTC